MIRSISARAKAANLALGRLGRGIGLLEVAAHDDVLVVEGGCRTRIVEAPCDHQALVDDYELVVHLAYAVTGPVLEELDACGRERLGRRPRLGALAPVEHAPHALQGTDQADHRVVDARSADQSKLGVYGAQRTSDGALTAMVVNKTSTALKSPLKVTNFTGSAPAQAYRTAPAASAPSIAWPTRPVSAGP